jgi:transposase
MKKLSTRAAVQSRNISQQKLTIGLDLGERNCWYCMLDEAGQIQLEQRVRTTARALQEVFGAMPRSRIVVGGTVFPRCEFHPHREQPRRDTKADSQ